MSAITAFQRGFDILSVGSNYFNHFISVIELSQSSKIASV